MTNVKKCHSLLDNLLHRLSKEDTTIVQLDILDEQIGCIFSTVDQFSNSILWLRNVLEVCLKGISISIMPLST